MLRRRAEAMAAGRGGDWQGPRRGALHRGARAAGRGEGLGRGAPPRALPPPGAAQSTGLPRQARLRGGRAPRRGGDHRSLELSGGRAVPLGPPGAPVRQRHRAQAERALATLERMARRPARRAPAGRGGPARARGRHGGRGPARRPAGCVRLHRLDRDRPPGGDPVRRARHPLQRGDGWEGSGHRPRRLRPRPHRRRHHPLGAVQRRPGLRRDRDRLRRARHRRPPGGASTRRLDAASRRAGPRDRGRRRAAGQRAAARGGEPSRRGRPGAGGDGRLRRGTPRRGLSFAPTVLDRLHRRDGGRAGGDLRPGAGGVPRGWAGRGDPRREPAALRPRSVHLDAATCPGDSDSRSGWTTGW